MLSLLSLSLFAVAAPLPLPKTEGVPPRVEIVRVDEAGRPFLNGGQTITSVANVVEMVPVYKQTGDGRIFVEVVPVTTQRVERGPKPVYLDTREVQIFGPDGKRIDPAEARKLLTRSTRVLVSTDGKPIARSERDRHREAVLWVVHPELTKAATPATPIKPPPTREPVTPEPIRREPRAEK